MKTFIYGGLFIGSYIGSSIPKLWNSTGGIFSISSIILSTIFAILGAFFGKYIYEKYF